MVSSDHRIPVARTIDEPRDTDQELPPSDDAPDTWPPGSPASWDDGPPRDTSLDTIPTPPPSSTTLDELVIPPLSPFRTDAQPAGDGR